MKNSYNGYIVLLIIILFVFFAEYHLYKMLHVSKIETMYQRPNEIIVSLSTSPTRIVHIEPLIKTLSSQTIPPDKIVLNLPHVFKRTNDTFENIPDFITKNPMVKINMCEDIGPATKVVPTTKFASSPDSIIISVDDDIEYKNNMIEILLQHSKDNPNSAITGESYMKLEDNKSELVEGYSSVLYKRKFIDDLDPEVILNYPKFCYLADDFIISNHLRKKNIDIVVVKGNKPFGNIFLEYGNGSDALRNGANDNSKNNVDNYQQCSKHLKESGSLYIKHYDS